jgi:hypothetical protein
LLTPPNIRDRSPSGGESASELPLEVGDRDLAALERVHRVGGGLGAVRRAEPFPQHTPEERKVDLVVLTP